jgi:hypothetical protein
MKKFLKHISLLFLFFSIGFNHVKADLITVGTGTTTSPFPFYTFYMDAVTYLLYLNTEIIAAGGGSGTITSIAFNVQSVGSPAMNGLTIYMQNTTANTVTAPITSGWVQVYTIGTYTPTIGWNTFQLNQPFEYDDTKNLLIKVCFDNNSWSSSSNVYATSVTNLCYARYMDNSAVPSNTCTIDPDYSTSPARANIQLNIEMGPTILGTFPAANAVLATDAIYNTPPHKPGLLIKRKQADPPIRVSYKIRGPKPSTNIVYTAVPSGSDTLTEIINLPTSLYGTAPSYTFQHRFSAAKGYLALIDPNNPITGNTGGLDLFSRPVVGGEYEIQASLRLQPPFNQTYLKTYTSSFYISLANDLAITQVMEPRIFTLKKFPAFIKTPIRFEIKNVGANPITEYKVYVKVFRNNQIVWQDSLHRKYPQTMSQPLAPIQGTVIEYELKDFIPQVAGYYNLQIQAVLLNANDESPINNLYPQPGEEHKFWVVYDQEPEADTILAPFKGSQNYVGRPVRPIARFANNGLSDMSFVRTRIEIANVLTPNTIIHRDTFIVQDIPAGVTGNFTDVYYSKSFIPQAKGTYRICAYVDFPGDPEPSNNIICDTFNVVPALSGTYTIGYQNINSSRNYPTVQDAVNDLYLKGIEGPVVFELTDENYNVGSTNLSPTLPALDLRTRIYGVSPTNTITFRPAANRAGSRASVRINLITNSGIGIQFGQADQSTNPNASINIVVESALKRQYAQNNGYIIFDGGNNKSLLFTLQTNVPQRIVFYMLNAMNVTVKNCIITDGLNQPASFTCQLPNNILSGTEFRFDKEYDPGVYSYSAAFTLRSIPPMEEKFQLNYYNLDTITTNNIQILNNEISNFGYGIISNGIGMLLRNGFMTNYYNRNNVFRGNFIKDVSAMGIFLGFERNTIIERNRIDNVMGTCGNVAAGICLGNEVKTNYLEYSNYNIYISGNEISNVIHSNESYGIRIRQVRLEMIDIAGQTKVFPDANENIITINNLIWGINGTNANTNKYGIRYYTKRDGAFDVPLHKRYFTNNDRIVNNTVIVSNDEFVNTGVVAGIAIQHARNTFMKNNAIGVLDSSLGNNQFAAAVIYQGMMPNEAGSVFNRNAFWVGKPGATPIYRFIQITDSSTILEYGHKNNFLELSQWYYWTGQDLNSVVGDFFEDMTVVGSNPPRLRVKTNPTPIGSILNNRGDRLPEVVDDIDGRPRGVANQRYDIGAIEFDGRLYNNDLEVMLITTPASYKEFYGPFADAEYIMTQAPVNVKARVRNSGSNQLTNVNLKVDIYRETPAAYDSTQFVGVLEKSKIVPVTITSTDDIEVDFLLDNENGLGDDWHPQTYADLRGMGYTIPPQFKTMQPNVTPRYRFVLSVDNASDEVPSNNIFTKYTRFYIKRSSLSILLSVENSHIDIDTLDTLGNKVPRYDMTNLDQIAGRLNYDSLVTGFKRMGFVADYTLEVPRYDIDIFERNAWEPKAVNYTIYRTLVWSDANDKPLTRFQTFDLQKFLAMGEIGNKRNIIIGSQEFIRENQDLYPFINYEFRARYSNRNNTNLPYNLTELPTQRLVGLAMTRDLELKVLNTGWVNNAVTPAVNDLPPATVYHDIFYVNDGFSRITYYAKHPIGVAQSQKILGIGTTTLSKNILYFGLDWRHFGDPEFMARAIVDFMTDNEGYIIPIELLSFDANSVGNRVELNWTTASEQNSARFDIERALITNAGKSAFVKIDEVPARGNSATNSDYFAVDKNVSLGNTYAYRLKMIDLNGEFKYSNEQVVVLNANGIMNISDIMPNPVKAEASFDINLAENVKLSIEVIDISGKIVKKIADRVFEKGMNNIKFDTRDLSNGSYKVIIRGDKFVVNKNFTVTR